MLYNLHDRPGSLPGSQKLLQVARGPRESMWKRTRFAFSRAFILPCPLQGSYAMSSTFVKPEIAYNDPVLNKNEFLQRKYNLWSTTLK